MIAAQEAVAHSQALMVKVDALIAEVTRECGLCPAYRPALSEPKSAAQWRDSAHEAFVKAETMRDADARRIMREIAMRYETLASMVEIAILRQDKPPQA